MFLNNCRKTDADENSVVEIKVSIKQLKLLERLAGSELADAEQGVSLHPEKTLQSLLDQFWKHLYIKLTPAELEQRNALQRKHNLAANEAYEVSLANSRANEVAA